MISSTYFSNKLKTDEDMKLMCTQNQSQALQKLFDTFFIKIGSLQPKLRRCENTRKHFNMELWRHDSAENDSRQSAARPTSAPAQCTGILFTTAAG